MTALHLRHRRPYAADLTDDEFYTKLRLGWEDKAKALQARRWRQLRHDKETSHDRQTQTAYR